MPSRDRMKTNYHIAQINIARMRGPLESPVMEGFVARLEEINALADHSPGFVWRLQTEEGDATSVQAFDDPLLLVNLSVWETIEALHTFIYRSTHLQLLQGKKSWFKRPEKPHLALWWIAAGHEPSVAEAKARLELLQDQGPGPDAFTFSRRYPVPASNRSRWPLTDLSECPLNS